MYILLSFLAFLPVPAVTSASVTKCKTSIHDSTWPSQAEWSALNTSIDGTLIRVAPAASSCYVGNPFDSPYNCSDVTTHWAYAAYHSQWPESVDYSIWSNNSCVPPGQDGYTKEKGCNAGGMPQYIVNATTEAHVAAAMGWATRRNIRIVVKSTGHDLSGRSTGANALSIWTHNFNHIQHNPAWLIPGTNETADVMICGGGNTWGHVYTAAHQIHRAVVGGEDATVGLGGHLQNGGHGLLSSHYGLGSDQVYQATVITSEGHRLIANDKTNEDLFWAVRGGGGGQFGVVTEFVLKTYPVPSNVVSGSLIFYPAYNSNESEKASWKAFAETVARIPDWMDAGITGQVMGLTGESAVNNLGLKETVPGASVIVNLVTFNSTTSSLNATLQDLSGKLMNLTEGNVNMTLTSPVECSYWVCTKPNPLSSQSAGAASLFTSRLLGRAELSDLPHADLTHYLQQISASSAEKAGSMVLFGLQAGPGPAKVPQERRGSTLPAWRTAYAHTMAYGGSVNTTANPAKAIEAAARWYEKTLEPVWRNWAPNSGAYMNEGNPFSSTWKRDFYGEHFQRLRDVKMRYDPGESLYVRSGIRSNVWEYDLQTGLLCCVEESCW